MHRPSKNQRKTLRKPSISFIGAGRMGTALARALSSKGYEIDAMVARHKRRARRAAELAGARHALILTNKQLAELPVSDIFFITTPDDAIEITAVQLAAN